MASALTATTEAIAAARIFAATVTIETDRVAETIAIATIGGRMATATMASRVTAGIAAATAIRVRTAPTAIQPPAAFSQRSINRRHSSL